MKKEVTDKDQTNLFEERREKEEKLFNLIKEEEIEFPLFFKNKSEDIFTLYFDYERFEQISVRKGQFLSCIVWGFNEQIRQCKGDIKIFLYCLYKNQIEIQAEEYEEVFNRTLEERKKFFSTTDYKYQQRELSESQKNVKHKWKPIEL